METADAIVIGAGIFGTSIAFQLAARGAGRVALIDGQGPAAGMSGRTFSQVRRHYSNPLTIRLANRGFEILRDWSDEVGVGDPGYVRLGYLMMVPEPSVEACRRNVGLCRAEGVDTAFIGPDEIAAIEPLIALDGIAGAAHEPDAGFVDVTKMILCWLAAGAGRGLRPMFGSPVVQIETEDDRVTGVRTAAGGVRAPVVVNAAGVWGPSLVASLGLDLPISFQPLRMAQLRQPVEAPLLRTAITDAAGGLVMRPDRGPLALAAVYEGRPATAELETYDDAEGPGFEALVRATLARRAPAYAKATWEGTVAGVYDVTPDWHPVIGWAPGIEGLYLALGWSGHGLKLAPAVGETVADEILGREPAFDLTALRLERFAPGPRTLGRMAGHRGALSYSRGDEARAASPRHARPQERRAVVLPAPRGAEGADRARNVAAG